MAQTHAESSHGHPVTYRILPVHSNGPFASMMLRFRLATAHDADALADLNYRTFVEEIPQHAPNAVRRLVDKFDAENTYVVAEALADGGRPRLVGMICIRGRRPFSLDGKLPDLNAHLPPHRAACEVRLLAVETAHRTGAAFRGLVATLADEALRQGYDLALISGTTRQTRLYRHLGFEPFGPLVGTDDASYQPMYLTLDRFRAHADTFDLPPDALAAPESPTHPANFLPGPVTLWPGVAEALAESPQSHRCAAFHAVLDDVRRRLNRMTNAANVQVLVGSGTLANDAVAAQLAALDAPGLVLVCGEFGERLVDHARRWKLPHQSSVKPWGAAFYEDDVVSALDAHPEARWLWAVHLETSTGVLLDLPMLARVCRERGVRLALDAVSSLGTVPVDLSDVWMASSTSGKGLGALAGLALVFHADAPSDVPLPRYLDLRAYASADGGVAYTHSSPLVHALAAALHHLPTPDGFARIRRDTAWLRGRLRADGWDVIGDDRASAPGVVTVALPPGAASEAVGRRLAAAGYLVACGSGYLAVRGWLQICLMGNYPRAHLPGLAAYLTP